jgi:hypothetical protein
MFVIVQMKRCFNVPTNFVNNISVWIISTDFVLCNHTLGDGKRRNLWEALRMQQQVYTSQSSEVYSSSRILMVQIMASFQTDTVVT